ncbi:hypothetical protein KSS87_003263 [Heliosperma pusillum]|nr:hypothetical protein KSS87_003263 [Heliosperma pusillum]
MKKARLIVHTRSYNVTMGNEASKTHCSHQECDTLKFAERKKIFKYIKEIG